MSFNSRQKRYATFLNKGDFVTPKEKYRSYDKDEFLAKIGTDPEVIYKVLRYNHPKYPGFRLPSLDHCNAHYLGQVALGKKKAFRTNEFVEPTVPEGHFYSLDYLIPEVTKYIEVMECMPMRYHRKGEDKDLLIMEDRNFIWAMFAAAKPAEFEAFLAKQHALHKEDQDSRDPTKILVPIELMEKAELIDFPRSKKGRTGRMIVNYDKTSTVKRKRKQNLRDEVQEELQRDMVWMPPADLMEEAEPQLSQNFVPVQSFKKAKSDFKQLHANSTKFMESVIKVPLELALAVEGDENAKRNAYEMSRTAVMKRVGWTGNAIPNYYEAMTKYNNHSN